ncbi:MAG: DedA family protein [Deltaproteobacteria bacterium]|nr:DedA family protein [Deltaproteobacteria bacterium]
MGLEPGRVRWGKGVGELLETAVFWVVETVQHWGYLGIFVMMAVESSFFPFPSEVAMIPAGYLAAQGEMNAVAATATGIAGSLVGAFFNYTLALWLGRPVLERLGRYLFIGAKQFDQADRYFEQHGEITTFVARLIPAVRQLISVPAGLARMNLARFALYTGLGAGLWCTILVAVGYWAGSNEDLWRPLLRDATLWVLGAAALLIGGYLYLHRRGQHGGQHGDGDAP